MEKFKVLLVDDDPSVLRSLKNVFRFEGYEIHTAENGAEALKIVRELPIDLILSDHMMPEMSGIELFKKVIEKNSDIICILVTAYSGVEVAVEAINQGGIYKYITKPWDDNELKITVRRALEHLVEVRERHRNLETIQRQNQELKELNLRLEQMVEERTAELLETLKENQALNRELELKVKELEARDQLLNHMLEVHTRDESLLQIATSIGDMIKADKVMIYLSICDDEKIVVPCLGWDRERETVWLRDSNNKEISGFYMLPPNVLAETLKKQKEMLCLEPEHGTSEVPYACLPIIKGENVLGVLVIANQHKKHPISEQNVQSLRSLLHYVSLVIEDIGLLDRLPDVSKLTEALEG